MKRFAIALLLLCNFVTAISIRAQAATGFTKIGNVTTLTFSDAGCPLQSTCYYQITAVDTQGFESAPASCSATQLCIGGNTAVAVMPSSGSHTVALTWAASATPAVTYNVYRHIGPLPSSNLTAIVN